MSEAFPDGPVASASVAAQHLAPEWGPERSERNLASVQARRARRRALGKLAGGTALLVAAAAVFLIIFIRKPAVAVAPSAPVAAAPAANSPKTTFADGSVARVSDD